MKSNRIIVTAHQSTFIVDFEEMLFCRIIPNAIPEPMRDFGGILHYEKKYPGGAQTDEWGDMAIPFQNAYQTYLVEQIILQEDKR